MKLNTNLHCSILNCSNLVSATLIVALLMAAVVIFASGALAAERVIYDFSGPNDGIGSSALIADRAGNLFGTTFSDQQTGSGTVYELSPPRAAWRRVDRNHPLSLFVRDQQRDWTQSWIGDGFCRKSLWHDVARWAKR